MGYKTDGSSHSSGVKNEKDTCSFLTSYETKDPLKLKECLNCTVQNLDFKHIGGTKSVSDMDIYADGIRKVGVSIKNHKSGTYDHVNTTKLEVVLPKETTSEMDQFRDTMRKTNYKCDEAQLKICRKRMNDYTNSIFDGVGSDSLKKMIRNIHHRNPELVIVNDCEKKCLLTFKADQFEELSEYPDSDCEYFLKKLRNAKTSRSIFRRTSDGQVINTYLRFRITLNNGLSALLGLSNANSNSYYSIKIQQDNVDELLSSITPYSSCSYDPN